MWTRSTSRTGRSRPAGCRADAACISRSAGRCCRCWWPPRWVAWGFGAAVVGLALAWAYSAPPLRLKQNGWWGNAACAACYEGLPWITGAAVMADGQAGLAHPDHGGAVQRRRARDHDAERFQVGRGRPADGHFLAAGAAGRGERGGRSPAWPWPCRSSWWSPCCWPGAFAGWAVVVAALLLVAVRC